MFIGDVCGSPGRAVVKRELKRIKQKYQPDLVVANAENSAGGFGVSRETVEELIDAGVDICTSGDHTFSINDFYYDNLAELPFVRPANYEAPDLPGVGYKIVDLGKKGRVAVINLLGQELFTYTQRVRSPFWVVDELLAQEDIAGADAIFIDFHAEATSEKLTFGWYVHERVQAMVGTHTHVATADNRLLDGMAYVTDAGQVGPYEASLWVDFNSAVHNFKYPHRRNFSIVEKGPMIFNSVLIDLERSKSDQKYSPHSIVRLDSTLEL